MKVLAPPTKREVSISSGTFFKYDVTNRELYMSEHTPRYKNELKRKENNIVETTIVSLINNEHSYARLFENKQISNLSTI